MEPRIASGAAGSRGVPNVSVIVPVFNQSEGLVKCLAALEQQGYDKDRYEVIVIDNGSDVPVSGQVRGFGQVRCEHEERPGAYCARNKGVRLARGEILAFTDADCRPARDWIERGVVATRALAGSGMVAGRIECTVEGSGRPTAAEVYESILGFHQKTYLEQWGFSATANMFTTRVTFDQVGPFDEELRSGGDLDWGQRVRELRLPQLYREDVRVTHPARHSLRDLCRKNLRVAGGHHSLARKRGLVARSLFTQSRRELFPVRQIANNLFDERLNGIARKLEFASLVWFVGVVRTMERFRIQFGGLPRRV
jgi:glycosyltransferase involved in cell wall biosynthesis